MSFVARAPAASRGVPGACAPDLPDTGWRTLDRLIADARVTDVFLNPDGAVWVDRGDGPVQDARGFVGPDEAREIAIRLISSGGRHVDEATPCADVRLGDGVRIHAVLPPLSAPGPAVSIRIPTRDPPSLESLRTNGFLTDGVLVRLRDLVHGRANLLITGAAGSGKTTLLGALLAAARPTERIIVIEDVAELRIAHPHVIRLEARQANLEGAGAITLARLVREALRMRPDRLVVGECRGAEFRELLLALNTGHDGGAGTLHANSLAAVPARLEALGALAGFDSSTVARQIVSAFDAVLHVERGPAGRRLAAVGTTAIGSGDRLEISADWSVGA